MKLKDVIIKSLQDDYNSWEIDEYQAKHKSGTTLWVANGAYLLTVEHPVSKHFGWFERSEIMKEVEKCKDRKLTKLLEGINK